MKKLKKRFLKYLQTQFLPYFLQLFVRFIYLTNKKTYHYTKDINPNENIIVSMWHGDLLMQPLNYRDFRKDGDIKVIVSEHRDGETIRKVVDYLGVKALNGSSTRGGAKALIGAIKSIRNGIDVAITPDGPKGPIYSVADGIVVLSQKTKARIVPFSSVPSKYWQFKSWDKFIVPKPFGTIDFYIGEPFSVDGLESDEAKKLIYEKMMENQLDK
ncbi:MAG: lysophospholipid acyltransferase family protein [Campylobacterota bacterium]|nr:lysophospholipid acyltransferase family protein [Campylobacterota bacterium]